MPGEEFQQQEAHLAKSRSIESTVIAVCLGDKSSIEKDQLLDEYLKYQPEFKLWFFRPQPGEQNIENIALYLARVAKDADMLVAVQGSTHPLEGGQAEEVHIFFKGGKGYFVEFYPVHGENPPHKELARDLALLSRARSSIQTH